MAIAVSIRYDFIDDKGKTSFTKIRIPQGLTIAQYTGFAQGMAQLLADISFARITSASICIAIDLSTATIKAVAQATSDIAEKAYFAFNTAVNGIRKRLRLPSFSEAFVLQGTDAIDENDPLISAFVDAMEVGITTPGGVIAPVDSRLNDLTTLREAREVFRGT